MLGGVWNKLKSGASAMADGAKNLGTGVLNKLGETKDAVVSGAKSVTGALSTGVHGAINLVKDNAGAIGNFAKEHAGTIGQVVGGAAGALIGGPAGTAMGAKLGSMAGNWVQGGGLEKTKVGQAVTGLAKSIHSGDGNWKEHVTNLATVGAQKMTSRMAKHYMGADRVRRVKRALRHGGPIGGPQSLAPPHNAPRALTFQTTTGPSHSGGPASNVYDGGGVRARPSAPAMSSAESHYIRR
jgi:hypothetical protein